MNTTALNPEIETDWAKIRAISFARALSFLGSELTIFALILREKNSGASTVSLIFILGALPLILFAPLAGKIADKYSTRAVVFSASILQAILIFTLTFNGPKSLTFSALFLANSCGAASNPAWSALIPTLSSKEDLPRAFGFAQSAFAFAGLFAPALAGFLVTKTGYFLPFLIDASTFLVIAIVPFALGVNRPGVQVVPGEKVRAMEGINFLFREPLLRALIILLTVYILALGVVNVGEVFLVTGELGASALVYGFIGSAFALGSLAGSGLVAAVKVPTEKHVTLVLASLSALSISVMGIALAANWWIVLIFSLIAGLGNSGINAYGVAIFLSKSDADFQGRLLAGVSGVISSGSIVAMACAGPLIGIFGVREVIATGAVVSVLVLLVFSPKLRRQEVPQEVLASA